MLTNLVASSNRITEIKAASFTNLNVLDLSNNDIGHLPPELGNISSIQMLVLDGNRYACTLIFRTVSSFFDCWLTLDTLQLPCSETGGPRRRNEGGDAISEEQDHCMK